MSSARQRPVWLAAAVGAAGLHLWLWASLALPQDRGPLPAAAPRPAAVSLAPPALDAQAEPRPAPAPSPPRTEAAAQPRNAPAPAPAPLALPHQPPTRATEAPPPYPTLPAPPALLSYELRRGTAQGQATLLWQPTAEGYEARLERWLDGRPLPSWHSRGGFDGAGLAPQRQTDERLGRARRATNFQREAGKISFSGSSQELPLPAGAQDRLSWMLQLAAIVAARPAAWVPGEVLLLPVAAGQGRLQTWRFVVQPPQALDLPLGRVESAVFLQRLPEGPYEAQIDIWLDPRRHFLPARLRWSREGSDQALEMSLQKEPSPP